MARKAEKPTFFFFNYILNYIKFHFYFHTLFIFIEYNVEVLRSSAWFILNHRLILSQPVCYAFKLFDLSTCCLCTGDFF